MEMTPEIESDIRQAIDLIDGAAMKFADTLPEVAKVTDVPPDYVETVKAVARHLGTAANRLNQVLETFGQNKVPAPAEWTSE